MIIKEIGKPNLQLLARVLVKICPPVPQKQEGEDSPDDTMTAPSEEVKQPTEQKRNAPQVGKGVQLRLF